MQKNWSPDEIETCLKLYRAGEKSSVIADTIGRTQRSVKQFILRRRRIDPDTWRIVERKPKTTIRQKTGKPNTQKCDDCYYASGATRNGWKCPWADRLQPVKGWDATAVEYKVHNTNAATRVDMTWAIHDCPGYEKG